MPRGHGMRMLVGRSHGGGTIVHHVGRLSGHGVRATWGRHTPKDVVEGGISLVVWLSVVPSGSRPVVALVGTSIVCHAQSRDGRCGQLQAGVGGKITGWASMRARWEVGDMEIDCAAQGGAWSTRGGRVSRWPTHRSAGRRGTDGIWRVAIDMTTRGLEDGEPNGGKWRIEIEV